MCPPRRIPSRQAPLNRPRLDPVWRAETPALLRKEWAMRMQLHRAPILMLGLGIAALTLLPTGNVRLSYLCR